MEIAWEAEGGCGKVTLELWRANFESGHEYVMPIATLPNESSPHVWDVGGYGLEATGEKERYFVRVTDCLLKDCSTMCTYFEYW
jgi:hypothetical protein